MCISVHTTFAHTYCTSSSLYYMYKKHSIYYTVKIMFYVKSLVLCWHKLYRVFDKFSSYVFVYVSYDCTFTDSFPLEFVQDKKCELKLYTNLSFRNLFNSLTPNKKIMTIWRTKLLLFFPFLLTVYWNLLHIVNHCFVLFFCSTWHCMCCHKENDNYFSGVTVTISWLEHLKKTGTAYRLKCMLVVASFPGHPDFFEAMLVVYGWQHNMKGTEVKWSNPQIEYGK